MLLTLVLSSASDSCNNNDILLVVGYNYNMCFNLYFNLQYSPTTTSHYHALQCVSTCGYMKRAVVCHSMW